MLFLVVWWFLMLFSDSLAFFTSIALFFVPKEPLGSDNGPKDFFKRDNLSNKRSIFVDFFVTLRIWEF